MLTANRLLTSRCLLGVVSKQFNRHMGYPTKKGYWPEPITQQTLEQFLDDIDYFERPKKFINIGLRLEEPKNGDATQTSDKVHARSDELQGLEAVNVDQLLDMLGQDIDLPELDLDDTMVSREQLKSLAINHGIYRDLFGDYKPSREQIKFTPEQADRMSKLVPHYWISDQPHARADRKLKRSDPLVFFEPIVRVSARFVHPIEGGEEHYAHTAHHGNIIPASGALVKPSITLDCRSLPNPKESPTKMINDSQFTNWTPGQITCANFHSSPASSPYISILLLNLDYLHPNKANLHWMVANMKPPADASKTMSYDELCDYLPVHGIRGFGYSRYVFLVLQHDTKIDASKVGLTTDSRVFDARDFISRNKEIGMTPVGLSWFQTKWDESSNQIFHDHVKMRSPVYELVQEKYTKREMLDKAYPGKIPFNIFMDHTRDKKETDEIVLLERLKTIDPFDYSNQYVAPKVPPTVFQEENIPSWMTNVMFKKKNKIGYYRGLRPASVTIPLNNNADLDFPIRPVASAKKSPPGFPNQYPMRERRKHVKDLPYSKPASEHPAIFVQEDHNVHLDRVAQMMKDLKAEKSEKNKKL